MTLALEPARPRDTGWRQMLLVNLPLPLMIASLVGAGLYVESLGRGAVYYRGMMMLCGFNIILAVSLQLINGFSGQFSLGHAGFMAVGAYFAAYPAINFADTFQNPMAVLWFYLVLSAMVALLGGILVVVVPAIRSTKRIHAQLPLLILMLLAGWLLIDLSQATAPSARHWLVWSRSFTGLANAFTSTITGGLPIAARCSAVLPAVLRGPICFLILVIGGGSCAAIVGLIVGVPALRLRGDYLAIATLGLAEIIRVLIRTSVPFGAALGLTGIPRYTNLGWLYTFVLITIVVVWRIAYSAKGRAIVAVRDDEIAASAMGVDTTHHKVLAFVVGSFFAGVAGAMFALYEDIITPDSFTLTRSIEAVAMVTLGGLGSISGAILAAIVLTLLPELLRPIADYRMVIYSLLLIVMMLARPQGLLGGRELWPRRWR